MDYLKIHSYNGIHLGQHIIEFYSTLVPENIFFQGMSISYVFQKDNKLCLSFDTNFNNGIETIREISFSLNTINRLEYYKKIKIKNILDCKKIEDIYDYYYDGSVVCKEFKIDLKDKRISFMINEYKFTFNLLTGEIKKIFDTKKMLEIKRS